MKNTYKPQLCPNEQIDLAIIKYPMMSSVKLDGIRAIFKDGELFSRSLKLLPNRALDGRFRALKEYSKKHNVVLDGELFCTSVSFNDLSGIIRSDDKELPDDLDFWCFDLLDEKADKPFSIRYQSYLSDELKCIKHFKAVPQTLVTSATGVTLAYHKALKDGFEGLILRNPDSLYKFGRVTAKSNDAYKVKPYVTFDGKIIEVTQATEVREGAEKKINELGHSVTSQKKDDRVAIEKAATFVVMHEGKECGVSLPMTDEEKIDVWANKTKYIGRTIEYKGMLVGSKDVPRHCVFIRFRDDK